LDRGRADLCGGDPAHISQWRARYAVFPSNTEALVAAWLRSQLGVPPYSRKGNLPRLLLIALTDRATDGQRLAPLMAKLDRGRADLFNLVLGHMSRSYLLWTYMGLLIKDRDQAAPVRAAPPASAPPAPAVVERPEVVAAKNKEIAELRAELAALRLLLSIRDGSAVVATPASPPYSLSSSAASNATARQ
jgi:hypothetical protein